MCSEVKTHYIGILNGFVFHRRWRYWQCDGLLPLEYAVELYAKYKDLSIRAGGDASNPHPSKMSINPVYMEKLRQHLNNVGIEEYDKTKSSIIDDKSLPRFVNFYHIDTQLGLQKLAECIRSNNIHTELID